MSLSLQNGMLTFTSDNISTTTSSFVSSNFSDYVATGDPYAYAAIPLMVNTWDLAKDGQTFYWGTAGCTAVAEKSSEAAPIKKYHIKHR